jgi:hypothetical protein
MDRSNEYIDFYLSELRRGNSDSAFRGLIECEQEATSNTNSTNRRCLAKKTMKFPYTKCTTWLREKAAELVARGFKVEVRETAVPIQSFLLKIASLTVDAELAVWETGATSMIVVNLSTNDYDLDRSDIILVSDQFESELSAFFNLIK